MHTAAQEQLHSREGPLPRGWAAEDARLSIGLALFYLALSIALYASIIPTFFVADDFAYLAAIKADPSPAVIFSALAERYFRPGVVAVYYVNYMLAGLTAWPYHLSIVIVNAANAYLVFLLGRTLIPTQGVLIAALSGLLFVVFGGHAEAVSWIGGMADPLVTMFVLAALLLSLKYLRSGRFVPYLVGCWVSFAAAILCKESAVVFPLLLVACTVAMTNGRLDRGTLVRRVMVALAGVALLLLAYAALRAHALGFTLVRLEGLGTSPDVVMTTRAFLLRSFLPQGRLSAAVWSWPLAVWILGTLVVTGLAWRLRRGNGRALLLLAVCWLIALLPVLPLSIGVATPESERFIYMASAFSSLVLATLIFTLVSRRVVSVLVLLMLCYGHVRALSRTNRSWREAAQVMEGTLSSYAEVVREHWRPGSAVYVLNVQDSVRGAYVFRRGFHEALWLTAPDVLPAISQTRVLSVYRVEDVSQPVRVVRQGPHTVRVDLGAGHLIGTAVPPTVGFTTRDPDAAGFTADFAEAENGSLVVYFTPRRTALVGRLPLPGTQ